MTTISSQEMGNMKLKIYPCTRERLSTYYDTIKKQGVSCSWVSLVTRINYEKLCQIIEGKWRLTCAEYVRLAEVLGWDISLDVNYLWYKKIYTPEEIARRLSRLGIKSLSNIETFARTELRHICSCYYGQYPKDAGELYSYLSFLAKKEKERGYTDTLPFEHAGD